MTDIVERLRDWHEKVHCPGVIDLSMAIEAADEIERLRAEIDRHVDSFERLFVITNRLVKLTGNDPGSNPIEEPEFELKDAE